MDVDGWGYGHAGAQCQVIVLARIEIDDHRNSLHNLHIIAGSVFRRPFPQAAKSRAPEGKL